LFESRVDGEGRDQVDFDGHRLHVRRAKKGNPSTHLLQGDEMRALRKLRQESPHSDFVFMSERGAPFSEARFAKMVERAGVAAGLWSRYSIATSLSWHKNIQPTGRYTELSPNRFKDFWR
jgi:hypothetical protein